MLSPLFVAGSHSSRPLHHDFVRLRLCVLRSGECIANLGPLLKILDERWRGQKQSEDDRSVDSIEYTPVSVCVLFRV
ncbi:uncharacterized protein BO72DRAFT_450235, partial [Aspergillus fijiensis CBS 313.89]